VLLRSAASAHQFGAAMSSGRGQIFKTKFRYFLQSQSSSATVL
jgi:hypothetical protein